MVSLSNHSIIRSFIAIPLPVEIKDNLTSFIKPFYQHDSAIKWAHDEGLHITLKFLGNVEEGRFESEFFPKFGELLQNYHPIHCSLRGLEQFPPRGIPRILWVGIKEESGELIKLANSIEDFFEPFGFAKEKRPFFPHITLARLRKKPSSGFLKVWGTGDAGGGGPPPARSPAIGGTRTDGGGTCGRTRSQEFGKFLIDRLIFYRSELTKGGAIYRVIKEFHI